MSVLNRSAFQGHPFHLVSPSPWPLFTCISLLTLTTSGVSSMHGFEQATLWLPLSLILLISSMSFWFRDVISEGTYLGNHTLAVQKGLNMGVALFIVSEALFFLAIFWAYFHSALSPTVELGAQWPPLGIEAINAFELPLLNTALLLASGVTITYAHHCLIQGDRNGALYGGLFTIILAVIFTGFQGVEYSVSSFTITDGAFGSCFYFGTGLIMAPNNEINNNDINKLSPYWVTGFTDAEGSFSIKVAKDPNRKYNIRIFPVFAIELHQKDIELLDKIKTFFGVGSIIKKVRKGKLTAIYSVQGVKDLNKVIIPHFRQYSLLTQKRADFILFSRAIDIIANKKHLDYDNILSILSFKFSMGKVTGVSKIIESSFPEIKAVKRPIIHSQVIESKLWLVGFIAGEGCFYVKTKIKDKTVSQVTPVFSISQDSRDLPLMNLIKDYLYCGTVEKTNTSNNVTFVVDRFSDICNKIIPLFEHPLFLGTKALDFKDFCEVCLLIKEKEHLTQEGKSKILHIKNNMNSKRKL